jgi:hypothetical protein
LKFTVPRISGNVWWHDESLLITNVDADFYQGELGGWAAFDFSPHEGNTYHFDMRTTNSSLAPLMADVAGRTNQLDGRVDLRLAVTDADTRDVMSWDGFGDMQLREGALWELPVFGVFAPVLNAMYRNLGSGRASDGHATFTITNGVVSTDDLELRSPAMRMQYRGSVDLRGNLNARAEAEALRNTAVIGPVVSTMLWPVTKLLEYKVSGTLGHPVAEPVYVPKALLFPLHPIQSIKGIFTSDEPPAKEPSATNAPVELK